MDQKTQLLFEHYRDSNAMTGGLRRERNRFFVYLLITVAFGVLLSENPGRSEAFVTELLSKLLGMSTSVAQFLPYHIVEAALLAVAFFFMVNLYQRAVLLLGAYDYIALLEVELRRMMGFGEDSVAFTREGPFYWKTRPKLQSLTKYFYALIIGAALALYLIGKLRNDLEVYLGLPAPRGDTIWAALPLMVDLVIGAPLLIVFLAFVFRTIMRDTPNRGDELLGVESRGAAP